MHVQLHPGTQETHFQIQCIQNPKSKAIAKSTGSPGSRLQRKTARFSSPQIQEQVWGCRELISFSITAIDVSSSRYNYIMYIYIYINKGSPFVLEIHGFLHFQGALNWFIYNWSLNLIKALQQGFTCIGTIGSAINKPLDTAPLTSSSSDCRSPWLQSRSSGRSCYEGW